MTKREWHRQWRIKNRKRLRKYQREYARQHREQINAANRRYYKSHRSERAAYRRKRAAQRKAEVMELYGNSHCSKCKCKDLDVLCLDHVMNNGCQRRAKGLDAPGNAFYVQLLRRKTLRKDLKVLCLNCNFKRRIERAA